MGGGVGNVVYGPVWGYGITEFWGVPIEFGLVTDEWWGWVVGKGG